LPLDHEIETFLESIDNKNTSKSYRQRLKHFNDFIRQSDYENIRNLLALLKESPDKIYDVLREYVSFLRSNNTLDGGSFHCYFDTVKSMLALYDVETTPRQFKARVKLPKKPYRNRKALTKEDILKILMACPLRIRTYIIFQAATGCRANEPLTIRLKDINFKLEPYGQILLHAKNTKTKRDRTIFLTTLELVDVTSLEKRGADLQTKTDSLEAEMQRLQKLYKQREDVMSAMQKELLDHKQQLLYVRKMNTQLAWTKTTPFDSYTELLKNPQVTGPDRELLESYKSEETRKISALEEQINKLEARVDSSYRE
jgi:uncharacterized small protein (DUF1192 family)